MNKATMESRDNKVNKRVYLLKEEWSKQYNYIYDDLSFERNKDSEKKKLEKIRRKDTKSMSLTINDILFGNGK